MRSSSNGVVIATKLLAFNSVITLCSEMLLKCWKTAYNIAGDNKWHWISMRMTTQERLSLGLIFVSGLFTAILFYILLPIFKQTTRLTISPYGLLPVTSLQHLDLDEVAFGAGSIIHSHLDLIPFFGKQKAAGKSDTANASAEAEALASLHMALEMKQNGKIDKALKLFKHALALSPTHPDILNHYGEFLEEQKDIVQAEHMYTRALTVCPDHLKALSNRQRTLPQVLELDENNLKRIDTKRDSLAKIPEHNSALRRMKKEAYFQHIYHTVAIEGNTMTLSQTRHIVETRMAVAGKSILEHNEILGLDAALSYVNSTLVHRIGAITVENILEIHKRVLGYADPIEAGTFRRTQVFVGAHVPPHPSDIKLLMDDFVQWLNEKETLQLHPINYAALAHYKLVFIHPFTDGNGRTARLLMNLILMQAGYPPVIIRKQDRLEYYEYLELANEGDSRPFERFIADCTERTLDVYLYATQEYPDNEIPALEGQDRKRKIILEE